LDQRPLLNYDDDFLNRQRCGTVAQDTISLALLFEMSPDEIHQHRYPLGQASSTIQLSTYINDMI
jgi:hypothetical protein